MLLCDCTPLKMLLKTLKKLWVTFLRFRWLCDWCPPFILRLKVEDTEEERQQSEAEQAHAMDADAAKKEKEALAEEEEQAANA